MARGDSATEVAPPLGGEGRRAVIRRLFTIRVTRVGSVVLNGKGEGGGARNEEQPEGRTPSNSVSAAPASGAAQVGRGFLSTW